MDTTITIKSRDFSFLATRQQDLIQAGFQPSSITREAAGYGIYSFNLPVSFSDAHHLGRADDRWPVANIFFQQAGVTDGKRGWYASLANNWASFDYKQYTLEQYLELEHTRQNN